MAVKISLNCSVSKKENNTLKLKLNIESKQDINFWLCKKSTYQYTYTLIHPLRCFMHPSVFLPGETDFLPGKIRQELPV